MQTIDRHNQVIDTQPIDPNNPEQTGQQIQEAFRQNAARVVIGEIPPKGTIVEMNGLRFEVKFVDYKRNELRLKLYTPAKRS